MVLSNAQEKQLLIQTSVSLSGTVYRDWKDFIVIKEPWEVTNLKIYSTEKVVAFDICWIYMLNSNANHSWKTLWDRQG